MKTFDGLMARLAQFIEKNCEETLTLKSLAREAHLSEAHLQKRFKAELGVSPKEFQAACRLKKLKQSLRSEKSVTNSIYDAGHGSNSRVYEKSNQQLGMTPKQYQRHGEGVSISYALGETALGKILIGATDRGICFLQFGKNQTELTAMLTADFPAADLQLMSAKNRAQFDLWINALEEYLRGETNTFNLPLDMHGTAFQIRVWKFLQQIPHGEVLSYSELAQKMKSPQSVRAIASACARNKIAILIPCHRVLRGTGELAGYRWGLERKQKLLEAEKKNQ